MARKPWLISCANRSPQIPDRGRNHFHDPLGEQLLHIALRQVVTQLTADRVENHIGLDLPQLDTYFTKRLNSRITSPLALSRTQ